MNSPAPSLSLAGLHRTDVDLPGLMSVLSKHLYSTPMVALRELVQNAHDSIIRRRIEQAGWNEPARIDVDFDRAAGILRITDTGAGLTKHEIHAYLATVGVGYTRNLRQTGHDDSGLIGMFGLGFLSAFVLAKRVTVNTTSYQEPARSHCYTSTNAEQYSVAPIASRPVGTEILLELQEDFLGLANSSRLQEILGHYCLLLKEPIYIAGSAEALNPEPPPWRQNDEAHPHPALERRRNLAFAARFEKNFEPICTLPLRPGPFGNTAGLLWIQDGATYGTSDNRNLSVFVRGMLLDDDARDLLPSWAGFVGGVIESTQLTPTASREDLQRDDNYRLTQRAISEALIEGLAEVSRSQPEAWRRILARHNEALLGAALCDERLFQLIMDCVRIPSSRGDLPVRDLLSRGSLHVIFENRQGFEEMLFRTMGVPVAHGHRYAVVPFLRRWAQLKGVRLTELGTEQGNRQLFTLAELPAEQQAWLETHLADGEKLIPARFHPEALPLVVVPDRDSELKRRLEADASDKQISQSALRLARQFTAKIDAEYDERLYINLDNPAIQTLLRAMAEAPAQAALAARLLKAFKVLMASRSPHGEKAPNQALTDLAAAVTLIVEH
ncbi:ATP-binding protein [Azovibrio restrictus]|uniref:ATP-binding protein n=1 Tax=Azovibrio restrictus TaxID=146938 RepID=UPI00047AE74A|nr:ATP-binding protein [Azovibrio restrictus]